MSIPRANGLPRFDRRFLLAGTVAGFVGAPAVTRFLVADDRAAKPESAPKADRATFRSPA
jgi:hypothetical protein